MRNVSFFYFGAHRYSADNNFEYKSIKATSYTYSKLLAFFVKKTIASSFSESLDFT